MYQTGVVLGATTTSAAAIVLPNTGANSTLAIVAAISMVVGVAVLGTSTARLIAKKIYKA